MNEFVHRIVQYRHYIVRLAAQVKIGVPESPPKAPLKGAACAIACHALMVRP